MQQKRGIEQYQNGFSLTLAKARLNDPYKWQKPKLVFVNSMSDLFHEKVPLSFIQDVFKVINETPVHTYQILTKRIDRVLGISNDLQWSKNIWLGVSVENVKTVPRIEKLKKVKALVKFISFEPLLECIHDGNLTGIDWVIVGGESGGKARKIEKEWVDILKVNCKWYNVPFFFKQWGKRNFNPDPSNDLTLCKNHPDFAKGGCMIDGRIFREFPSN